MENNYEKKKDFEKYKNLFIKNSYIILAIIYIYVVLVILGISISLYKTQTILNFEVFIAIVFPFIYIPIQLINGIEPFTLCFTHK